MIYDFYDIGLMAPIYKPSGLVIYGTAIGDDGQLLTAEIRAPWKAMLPFKDEIQRALHDDIAGELREKVIAAIDKLREEFKKP